MDYTQVGNSGIDVSRVGMGCWAIGGAMWGPQDDQQAIEGIKRAIDLGITFIDTAAVYGFGHSEELVCEGIKGRRDEVVVATKCGQVWDKPELSSIKRVSSPESIEREVDASLRRLDIDVIDLYQIHWPDEDTPIEDSMAAMLKLKETGKIRAIGVSNYSVEQMSRSLAVGQLDSLQPPYSMLNRGVEREILPFCQQNNIGVVVYSPMQRGLLTGKFMPGHKFAEGDHRANSGEFKGERFERNLRIVDRLRPIAEKYGKTMGQLAIAWVLMHPAVTVAIVGGRNPGQVEQNVGGAGWRIEQEDMDAIEDILANTE